MRKIPKLVAVSILTVAAGPLVATLNAEVKEFRPSRLNLFSPQQDVDLGREAAAEVVETMPVVDNAELTNYVSRIGQRLAASQKSGGYPYEFRVVNDPNINAFALPGGPIFVHTGLLAAADNEAQIAGVLAHEIAHVALRHGTHQVSKAQGIQIGLMLGASMIGRQGSIWNTIAQTAGGLGAQSLLLKYSRDAERDADLHGAQIMNEIGYDPTEMARFFEKLGAEGGQDDSFLSNFMADHPSPGNRVSYVNEQNQELPPLNRIQTDNGQLRQVKNIVAGLPAPAPPAAAIPQGGATPANIASVRPNGRYRQHNNRGFQMAYPENWEVYGDNNSDNVTMAPQAALVQDGNGQVHIAYGIIGAYYYPEDERVNLDRDTRDLLQGVVQSNQALRQNADARRIQIAGRNAIMTPFESPSPFGGQREFDVIVTVDRPEGLFYMVFIAPESEWDAVQQTFDDVVRSLRFSN